ncbi:MAG: hypothetical protein ING73_03045 [Rhodocyclaceae bacterium]|nr:hypothetical protein [Rhodocyclaceae bacterium]MCA3024852.1 hypothetical protein [Rhodocyclaceae bacterium]MCA3032322.1 hypothetical protein [Rhodocyclaceae bacterium]MCA3037849.1 hypothetical protein [Rhodocyclaceae bacterium]MCA3045894.1 hypothetical protein [Rhodocyclaceae bacterium]
MRDLLYLQHLRLAADLGDDESQFELATRLRKTWTISRDLDGSYLIWGADAFNDEIKYLQMAVECRHPMAQRAYAKYLVFGRLGLARDFRQGAKLYLAGLLGAIIAGRKQRKSLFDRVLSVASKVPSNTFLSASGRVKFTYDKRFDGVPSVCGIRSGKDSEGRMHIVIEQLPTQSLPSIQQSLESIATQVLYQSAAAGIPLDPKAVCWYEAYPAGGGLIGRGSLQCVRFCWDGVSYFHPDWGPSGLPEVPIDVSDIISMSEREARYGS